MAMSVTYSNFGGHVVYENRGGTERTYMRDPLGNTIGLLDMSGNPTDSWTYWPYGEVQNHTGSAATPLTFLGTLGYVADFLNQLYVRARHLRGDLTRWVTRDPLWPIQSPYNYTRQPTATADASGLADICELNFLACELAALKKELACLAAVGAAYVLCMLGCTIICEVSPQLCTLCRLACSVAERVGDGICYDNYNHDTIWCTNQYLKCEGIDVGGGL